MTTDITDKMMRDHKAETFVNEPELLEQSCKLVVAYFRQLETHLANKEDERGLMQIGATPTLPKNIVLLEKLIPQISNGTRELKFEAYVLYSNLKNMQDFFSKETFQDFKPDYTKLTDDTSES